MLATSAVSGTSNANVIQMNPESRTILPGIAFRSFATRYVPPTLSEGFRDITNIEFQVSFMFDGFQSNFIFTSLSFKARKNSAEYGANTGYLNSLPEV